MEEKEGRRVWNSTLRRHKKPKKHSNLKRVAWTRSKKIHNKEPYTFPKAKDHRPEMKRISKKQKRALTKRYFPVQTEFLKRPENRVCWICIGRSLGATRAEIREIMDRTPYEAFKILENSGAVITGATEVHHYAGRIGRLLDFVPYFVPECRGCRQWPHDNLRQARALDLVAPASAYNVFPENAAELWEEYKKRSSI